MTTIQERQQRATTRWPPRRYLIPLQLRYKARSEHGILLSFGQTRMMSSQDIVFGPSDRLKAGMEAEIVLAWPRLLDGRIPLQLVLEATITGSQDGVAEARILAYDFRTRRAGESGPRAERAGAASAPDQAPAVGTLHVPARPSRRYNS